MYIETEMAVKPSSTLGISVVKEMNIEKSESITTTTDI